jgi:DNA-binding MarR family transcriptional regulator
MKVEDAEWVERLLNCLDEFRKLHPNVTANQIVVFLNIALREGITQKELGGLSGLDQGTVSRIVALISDRGVSGREIEPIDLIRIGLSNDNYKSRAQRLSPSGKRVFNSLRTIMKGR